MHKKETIKALQKLTAKNHIFFTDRGNASINLALKLAKHLGKSKAYIQDQGGWITYSQFIEKNNLELNYLKTDYGLITQNLNNLNNSVLLLNSMPGYIAYHENIKKIFTSCKKNSCFLINDVSGSIGTDYAKYGDLIIGSFGRWKPLNLEYGGFIAFDDADFLDFFNTNFNKEIKNFFDELTKKLDELENRIKYFEKTSSKIKKQLKNFDIIHKAKKGFNVAVKFNSPEQKMDIIDFCKLYGYEFTLCPRYIRVIEDAISIEVKRLNKH